MGRIKTVQNSFASGELSPALHGRHDIKAYYSGAALLKNFIVRKTGGVRKRGGCDLLADVSAVSGARWIPFFYDSGSGELLAVKGGYARVADADGVFVQSGGADYTFAVPWTDAQAADLRVMQLGDTLRCTHPEVPAYDIRRHAADDWRVEALTGAVSVSPPPSLTAAPSDFGTANYSQAYALFAVKDGVMSEPRKKSASIKLPWPAGAAVALSWTADMRAADSYILGKKKGTYYGVLAQVYPEKTAVAGSGLTYALESAHTSTDYDFSATGAADLKEEDPNKREYIEVKLRVSKRQFHIPASGGECEAVFTYTANDACRVLRVWLGAYAAGPDRQTVVTADYSGGIDYELEGDQGTGEWAGISSGTLSCAPDGYAEITSASATVWDRLRLTLHAAEGESGALLRGLRVYSDAAASVLEAGSWDFDDTQDNFACRGVSGTTDVRLVSTAKSYADLAAGDDPDQILEASCTPVKQVYTDSYPVALATADEDGEAVAYIRCTSASVIGAVELRIFPGALVVRAPDDVNDPAAEFPSNIASARLLYSYDGSTWHELEGDYLFQSRYSREPLVVSVPTAADGQPAVTSAKGWALRLTAADPAEPIVLRGLQMIEQTVQSSFTDMNHDPVESILPQTFTSPGGATNSMAVRCAAVHEQRGVLAGAADAPFRIWFSATGDLDLWYANRPMTDADAFAVTVPALRASAIMHLVSVSRRLLAFTEGGVFALEGTSEGFSYRTAVLREVSAAGCSGAEPVNMGGSVLFTAADGREVLQLQYDLATDGMQTLERSVLADHLTESAAIVKMIYQRAPESTVWALLADGSLLSFTIQDEHGVYAWARQEIAGADAVLDILATGHARFAADTVTSGEVYALVSHGGRELLVRLRPWALGEEPLIASAATLDMCQSVTLAEAAAEVSPAAAYAAGSAVLAVGAADGATASGTAQESGTVLFPAPLAAGEWLLGFPVEAELQTLRPEPQDGGIQGLRKNVKDVLVRTSRSGLAKAGPACSGAPLYTAAEAAAADGGRWILGGSADASALPFGCWNASGAVRIVSPGAEPLEILEVITRMEVENQ